MAASSRSERQLMRQRGAGTRDNGNAVISLDFGPKDARQERQLMRQRGAGNRKLDKIDFAFSFLTPNRPRRSVSRTPQTATRHVNRSSEPPQRSSREPSTVRSVRYSSVDRAPPASQQRRSLRNRPSLINIEEHAETSREPPSEDGGIAAAQILQTGMSPFVSTPNRIFTIKEGLPEGEDGEPQIQDVPEQQSVSQPTSPLFVPQDDDKENEDSQMNEKQTQPKRKKRKSIIQHIGRKKRRTSEGPVVQSTAIAPGQNDHVGADADHEVQEPVDNDEIAEDESLPRTHRGTSAHREDETPRTNRALSGKRRGQNSNAVVGSGRNEIPNIRGEQLEDPDEAGNQAATGSFVGVFVPGPDSRSSLHEPVTTKLSQRWIPGQSMARKKMAARKRGSRMSISASPEPHDATDCEGDETYIEEEHSPEPPTPAPRRKPRLGAKRSSNATEERSGQRPRKKTGSTFPILTYRMTNVAALPTIAEEDENGGGPDVEGGRAAPFTDRAAPNGVDVLAQICRETIETAIETYEAAVDSTKNRAEVKRKRTALESYSRVLDQRLFDMSEAVEKRLNLEARLRKMKREKAELQARWLNLRQQRETLALTADDIRRQNWENDERSKRQQEISELAYRTELELEREQPADVSLEFLLRTVAGTASLASSEGGLLGQVKAFNGQLERVISGLDG